jgi:type IV fimbrial biogenesis protein FimT
MASTSCNLRRSAGFTMIELLIVVALAGVLLAVAAPGMKDFIGAGRMRSASSDLVADLILARSEARKRGAQVKVQPSASGWTGGWTVSTVTGAQQLGQRNKVGVSVTGAPEFITFDIDGRVVAGGDNPIQLRDGSKCRRIVLDPTGMPKSQVVECTS